MNIQVNISLCRVCMKSEIGSSMLEDQELQAKFEYVTNLRVQQGDNLPSLICEKCIVLLNASQKFIQTAHGTEKTLKTFLAKINNDFRLVTENAADTINDIGNDEAIEILEYIGATETNLSQPTVVKKEQSSLKITDVQSLVNSNPHEENLNTNSESTAETTLKATNDTEKTKSNIETCLLSADDVDVGKREELLAMRDDIESLVDFQSATDITKTGNELMDFDAILITDDDTVQLSEDPINEQSLKSVVYTEEYEALLEDDSASMDIILYEDEESTVLPTADVDETTDDIVTKPNDDISFQSDAGKDDCPPPNSKNDENKTAVDVVPLKDERATNSSMKQNATKQHIAFSDVESKRFYCTQCKRDFSTKTNLTRHLALHDGKRPFECYICYKGFSQNGTLKQHMYTHTGEKPHVCKICKRGFTQSKSLVFHMRRHSGDKPHQCDYCGTLFRQKDALKVHILKHHVDANERVFSCKICNKDISVQALRNHMKSHLNNHRFADRARNFMQLMEENDLLDDAVLMHDEVSLKVDGSTHVIDVMATSTTEPSRAKKYQCRKCFKCFAIKKNLMRHLSFHDIEPSELQQSGKASQGQAQVYDKECDKCQKKFKNSVHLNIHSNLEHTLECSQCDDMSFVTEKDLNEHLNEHSMEVLV